MADGIKAFAIGPQLAKLSGAYPRAQHVLEAAAVGQREKAILARLWISEGIPFAFRKCPSLYEEVRDSLAKGLELHAKQISIVGSGRLGYSLAPKKWGTAYDAMLSDLDLFAVSERLFEGLREGFERWRDDYDRGEAQPKTEHERFYWSANLKETPRNIRRGFIDSKRVPNWKSYGEFAATNDCLANIWTKLQKVDEGPKPRRRLSLRCYRDWASYEAQIDISLGAVVKKRHTKSSSGTFWAARDRRKRS